MGTAKRRGCFKDVQALRCAHLAAGLDGRGDSCVQVGLEAWPQHARHVPKQAVRVLAQLAVAQRQPLNTRSHITRCRDGRPST